MYTILRIVDLKMAVWWYQTGLYWAQICTDDHGAGIASAICNAQRPVLRRSLALPCEPVLVIVSLVFAKTSSMEVEGRLFASLPTGPAIIAFTDFR